MAMLAKQVWRLHTNPQSLISQGFKAKYYPTTDVLQATIGNALVMLGDTPSNLNPEQGMLLEGGQWGIY